MWWKIIGVVLALSVAVVAVMSYSYKAASKNYSECEFQALIITSMTNVADERHCNWDSQGNHGRCADAWKQEVRVVDACMASKGYLKFDYKVEGKEECLLNKYEYCYGDTLAVRGVWGVIDAYTMPVQHLFLVVREVSRRLAGVSPYQP